MKKIARLMYRDFFYFILLRVRSGVPRTVMCALCLLVVCACKDDAPDTANVVHSNITKSVKNDVIALDETPQQVLAAADVQIAEPGFIPVAAQREGDAEKGRDALLNSSIVNCGIPHRVFKQLPLEIETLPGRTGAGAQLPYDSNLIRDSNGVEIVASNCLTCHAAPLFGDVVVGLGNEFRDFTQNPSIFVERVGALVSGDDEVKAWEKYANRIAAISPFMQMETAGTNPANNLTFALMAHRDPLTMAWSENPLISLPSKDPPPVSVPPWWRMSKKNAMFWMGEGRGDHASIMMTAAILCTDSVDEMRQLDSISADIRAFIASLEPPAYPFEINQKLANAGESVFEANCSQCHGRYSDTPEYPNRLVALDLVGTDPVLSEQALNKNLVYAEWFNVSLFSESATAMPARGYVAPPLDGIWSTAPFLHNGSVPTIRALLDSKLRPQVWRHVETNSAERSSYDQDNLGWKFISLDPESSKLGDVSQTSADSGFAGEDRWLYDTRKTGHSAQGHIFGDGLTSAQRDAVLEYLKTL